MHLRAAAFEHAERAAGRGRGDQQFRRLLAVAERTLPQATISAASTTLPSVRSKALPFPPGNNVPNMLRSETSRCGYEILTADTESPVLALSVT